MTCQLVMNSLRHYNILFFFPNFSCEANGLYYKERKQESEWEKENQYRHIADSHFEGKEVEDEQRERECVMLQRK